MDSKKNSPTEPDQIQNELVLRPVGIVRNSVKDPLLKAGDHDIEIQDAMDDMETKVHGARKIRSKIIIKESMSQLLEGIEAYSHIIVLYWAHRVPESSRLLTRVHPMGKKENPLMGIFSTCSPARPNPVLMAVVQLHKKEKNVLNVSGLDAIDESPVIDIKPYVSEFYPRREVRIPEWMYRICEETND